MAGTRHSAHRVVATANRYTQPELKSIKTTKNTKNLIVHNIVMKGMGIDWPNVNWKTEEER